MLSMSWPSGGKVGGAEIAGAQEPVNRRRRAQHLELACGVDPGVVPPVGEQHGPRRAQRHQAMLIERQPVGLIVELLEPCVEPVREVVVDLFDRLRRFARGAAVEPVPVSDRFDRASAGRRTAAAGLMWNGQGDALVEGGGQQRGFAQPRMAGDHDALLVHLGVGHKVIHRPLQSPGPGRDGPAVVLRIGCWKCVWMPRSSGRSGSMSPL